MKENVSKYIKDAGVYLYIAVILFLYSLKNNTVDMDWWARILQGDAFFELGHILKSDPFSYVPTHFWYDHEWGSGVIFSLILNNFGSFGVPLFKWLILALIFWLIFKTTDLQNAPDCDKKRNRLFDMFLAAVVLPAISTLSQSWLRCHFFTYLFFILFIYISEYARKRSKYSILFLLPVLMVIWCNVHGGCVAGLGVLFLYMLGEFFNKRPWKIWLLCLILCFAALLVNPYGISYAEFIFQAALMKRPFVSEWISPFANAPVFFMPAFKIIFLCDLALFIYLLKKCSKDWASIFLMCVCAYISARYVKSGPFFILVSMIFLYNPAVNLIKNIGKEKIINALMLIYTIAAFFIIFLKVPEYPLVNQPYKTVEFIRINGLKGKIVSPFDMGSYIAYKLFPDILIYMDGRYEEVYFDKTKEMLDYFYNTGLTWDEILKPETAPDYIIIPNDALINDYMNKRKDYIAVFRDENNILYSKSSVVKEKYILPSNSGQYYLNTAFQKGFKFTDKIYINGKEVQFR